MHDVAVIGAGPVGSRIAGRLAEKGIDVVVFDKKKDLGEKVCCTGIVGQECIDRFAVDNELIFRQANSATLYSPSGKTLRVSRQEPQAAIIDRGSFNAWLAQLAMNQGVRYITESTVTGIEVTGKQVALEIERKKSTEKIDARVAVIASGFGSRLTEMAGLGRIGDFAMGVQADVEVNGIDEVEVYSGREKAPGFFAWLVPTTEGRGLAGLMSRRDTGSYMKKLLVSLAEQGKIKSPDVTVRYCGVALKPLRKASTKRILVAGSAAGQVKPTTAGGVYYGMLCADIAADVLFHGFETDNLTAASLATYDKLWKRKLGREIRTGSWSRKFFESLSDDRIETIFDIIVNSGLDKTMLESDDVNFDWHGTVIMKMIRFKTLTGIIKSMKIPFPSGK